MSAMDRNPGGNNLVAKLLTNVFCTSTATTFTPGTGGIAMTITQPFKLRLMTANGTATSAGTELSGATGYTAGGNSMQPPGAAFSYSGGIISSVNAVSWSVGSAWPTVVGAEVVDNAALRYLFGPLAAGATITGAASGDTVSFPAGSVTYDATGY